MHVVQTWSSFMATFTPGSYRMSVTPEQADTGQRKLAHFLTQYLEEVESFLHLISSCRSGDWEGYLAALEGIDNYFFARDPENYARLTPVHLA